MMIRRLPFSFLPLALIAASCSLAPAGDNADAAAQKPAPSAFAIEEVATFDEPWAIRFDEGTGVLFVTEKKGAIRFVQPGGKLGTVTGVPVVDYGGQGGLGDFLFAPGQTSSVLDRRIVYLSWVEAGQNGTRGAAVGRAEMVCEMADACALQNLTVIWRQHPKVTGRGHFSHRLASSPDGRFLYIASGDRQKMAPAQDRASDLGKIVRLPIDAKGVPTGPAEQVSLGHRNVLGLRFDPQGRLWEVEHGPAGGDELNLVTPGANYGWPNASNGSYYDGRSIPDHGPEDGFAGPAISWSPVIAPGDMIFYTGKMFPEWNGNVVIAAMIAKGIVRVAIDGTKAREVARYSMENRIRAIAQAPDGAIWLAEDGKDISRSRLLRLTPATGK